MEQTLGQNIGTIETRPFKVTLSDKKTEVNIKVKFDYSGMSNDELFKVLNDNRIIRLQNSGMRGLTKEQVQALDGRTFSAAEPTIGKVDAIDKAIANDPKGLLVKSLRELVNQGVMTEEAAKAQCSVMGIEFN